MKFSFDFLKNWFSPWQEYVSELVGTMIFAYVAVLVMYGGGLFLDGELVAISAIIAFAYTSLVFSTVNISGGFLNPAITLSLWLAQKLGGVKTSFFIISQLIGGFIGYMAAHLTLASTVKVLPSFEFGLGVSAGTVFAIEAIFTAILVFVVFATFVDKRGSVSFGPLSLGLLYFALILFAWPITGATLNIVQIVGSAFFLDDFSGYFIHLAAPLLGSITGVAYSTIFLKVPKRHS